MGFSKDLSLLPGVKIISYLTQRMCFLSKSQRETDCSSVFECVIYPHLLLFVATATAECTQLLFPIAYCFDCSSSGTCLS